MFNIEYSEKSFERVNKFVENLKDYYKKFYFDTWLVDEYLIVSGYINKTNELFDEIIDKIENTINLWIFWVELDVTDKYKLSKLVIKVRSYSIVVIIEKGDFVLINDIYF